jgi:nucleoside-diphosphate-sugar epimerase
MLATDAYSFSKQVMESIGRYFWERDGISSVMLRLPAVVAHEKIVADTDFYARYDLGLVRRLLELRPEERTAQLARMRAAYDRYRRAHRSDTVERSDWWRRPDPDGGLSEDEFAFMRHKVNFFTYVDELDSAQAIAQSLTAEYEGSHPLFINASRNSFGLPLEDLAKLFAPDEPELRPVREGDTSAVSIDRARALIGFEPRWEISGSLARRAR